jgi:hypothetical protein
MRKSAGILLCCTALLLAQPSDQSSAGSEKKGIVTYAEGQVKKKPSVSQVWLNAPVNTEVITGDMVRTYPQSPAELNLMQLDVIRIAPQTIIDIIKLYQETKEKKVKTEIKLQKGQLWASVHEVSAQTDFDIAAPVAAAAITGTVLQMKVDDDTTTQLKVYKGEVHITNTPEKTDLQPKSIVPTRVSGPRQIPGPHQVSVEEWMYIVKAMQQITINKNGGVVSMGGFQSTDKDEKTDWVKWNKLRDLEWLRRVRKDK